MNRLIMFLTLQLSGRCHRRLVVPVFRSPGICPDLLQQDQRGLWTNPPLATVTHGNATNTGTFPGAGDNVFIGDGYTIYFNTNGGCNITIGRGASGALEFYNLAIYWMTVTGDINNRAGGRFAMVTTVRVRTSSTSKRHHEQWYRRSVSGCQR